MYESEQRTKQIKIEIEQIKNENARLRSEDAQLAEIDARIAALWLSSNSSSTPLQTTEANSGS